MTNKCPQTKRCPYCKRRLFYSQISGEYQCFHSNKRLGDTPVLPNKGKEKRK